MDEAYLTHLTDDAVHNPTPENLHKLKQGYQAAAVFLTHKGDPEAAILKYREALKYLPHDQGLTLALGYLLWKQEHYLEAVDLLLPEADRYPQSPDFRVLLGSAYYGMENLDQAITEWNKALALEDNAQLREAVARGATRAGCFRLLFGIAQRAFPASLRWPAERKAERRNLEQPGRLLSGPGAGPGLFPHRGHRGYSLSQSGLPRHHPDPRLGGRVE